MMNEFRKDFITGLVDGEINDSSLKQEIIARIESDKSLLIDYKVQLLVKNLVKEKIIWKPTPDKVKVKVLKKINSQIKVENSNSIFSNLFEKPAFSFATAFVVILAIVLIVFNRPDQVIKKNFEIEQAGSKNMFIQAKNNFNSIVEGKLLPQITSENSDQIQSFFKEKGVTYSTAVPELKDWNLLGAVVSEDGGEKFAHHVYVNARGKLAYLFQVDESYLYSHEIITLSDDLIKYLDEGYCYSTNSGGSTTLFTKVNNNICAIVSNENQKEIEKSFCSL